MRSGYSLKTTREWLQYPLSLVFFEDYEYLGDGDLDENNGRYCITPDYPTGTLGCAQQLTQVKMKQVEI